jgi:hypothetical protein
MLDLNAIEARANAATPGMWYPTPDSINAGGRRYWACSPATPNREQYSRDSEFMRDAREDVLALIARVRELEAECERTRIFGSRKFAELRAADVEQMRGYGLSYEGVRKVLHEYNDGEISFGKLMDLIRAAARAMAEDMKK